MNQLSLRKLTAAISFCCLLLCQSLIAQNSVLVNFGGNACDNSTAPFFSLIKNPLSPTPVLLSNCSMGAQIPDVYNVFVAYNPKNNKLYIADIRDGLQTKIWLLDVGLPFDMSCPIFIPVTPTYSYSYISNNFEFDNNGDLWSFSNYNSFTGTCNLDKFDVNTGNVISTRVLQFPEGNYPTTIQSGDLTILPNGRMFASLGNGICRLYEITNYSSGTGNATATFLRQLPKDCYGIAYLDGILELAGSNFAGNCYYFDYEIATGILGPEKVFQSGKAPIDNTSITPSIGTTKRLLNAVRVNNNTADLTYEIYAENLGNVILNNVNLTDDLGAAFGTGNVSNVSVSFVPGFNNPGLTLNSSYNGTTVKKLLNNGQNLPNNISTNQDYYFKVQLQCRVTNLVSSTTYLNSAIATANIGAANTLSLVEVSDSSNNGTSLMTDPNKNGNAGDLGENVPTPFVLQTLPVTFLNVSASWVSKNTAAVQWQVATPVINAANFEVQYSRDGRHWIPAGTIAITDQQKSNYQLQQANLPSGTVYYRIKQTDRDGTVIYSRIVLLQSGANGIGYTIFPNPAGNVVTIRSADALAGKKSICLLDAAGRRLIEQLMNGNSIDINTSSLPNGTYLLQVIAAENISTQKLIIRH